MKPEKPQRRCARCDYAADDLAEHATDARHPLCICCCRSLRHDEPRTCERCITRAREHLSVIVDCYALLPSLTRYPASGLSRGVSGPRSDEQPIPGGEVTVLLAGGSEGSWAAGEVHAADHHPGDPPSVAFELARWEDDWRSHRGDPAADGPATVTASAGYLEVHTRWSANTHPAFDEYMSDLRKLRGKLEAVTGLTKAPIRNPSNVPCFDCGEKELVREWTEQGFDDQWQCRACHRRYDHGSYWLAMRARLEAM